MSPRAKKKRIAASASCDPLLPFMFWLLYDHVPLGKVDNLIDQLRSSSLVVERQELRALDPSTCEQAQRLCADLQEYMSWQRGDEDGEDNE
jgi:hypothetical protein